MVSDHYIGIGKNNAMKQICNMFREGAEFNPRLMNRVALYEFDSGYYDLPTKTFHAKPPILRMNSRHDHPPNNLGPQEIFYRRVVSYEEENHSFLEEISSGIRLPSCRGRMKACVFSQDQAKMLGDLNYIQGIPFENEEDYFPIIDEGDKTTLVRVPRTDEKTQVVIGTLRIEIPYDLLKSASRKASQ